MRGWVVLGCGLFLLPRRRMVASRWREPFFLLWSFGSSSLARGRRRARGPGRHAADGGFILPLIFSAISYPVVATAIVGSFVLRRAAIAAGLTGQRSADTTFQLLALAFAALMGVWQARGRERRAAQLSIEHRRAQRYLDVAGTMIVVLDPKGGSAGQPPRVRGARVHARRSWPAATGSTRLPEIRERSRARHFQRALAGIKRPERERECPCSRARASAAEIAGAARSCPRPRARAC